MTTRRTRQSRTDAEAEELAKKLYSQLMSEEVLNLKTSDGHLWTKVLRNSQGRTFCQLIAFMGDLGRYRWIWTYEEVDALKAAEKTARMWIDNYEAKIEARIGLPHQTKMTHLLYQTNSYLREFDATITQVNEPFRSVLLDQTAFFPGGGGQMFDTGTLTCAGVTYSLRRATKSPEGVWHALEGEQLLPAVGATVHGELDWVRRYANMRTHTAMHILCGVVFRDYGAMVTGGDMEPLKGRMDFEFESMSGELVRVIEQAVNAEVDAARPVKVQILPREIAFQIPDLIRTKINLLPVGISEIRTIEIEGLDLQADGGTHVRNTSEVGRMRIVDYKSKGKINKRIYVELGEE